MTYEDARDWYSIVFNATRGFTKEMEAANGTIRMLETQVFRCGPCNSVLEAAYVAAVAEAVRILQRR